MKKFRFLFVFFISFLVLASARAMEFVDSEEQMEISSPTALDYSTETITPTAYEKQEEEEKILEYNISKEGERILEYSTIVEVNKDSSMDIYEHITVLSLGQNIKLGIYRDIPKSYNINGLYIKTPIEVVSVTRDGQPENFWVENSMNVKTIQIGPKEDIIYNRLKPGIHKYLIHWKTSEHIRGFKDYDEVYFNAIGTKWNFPIESATVQIVLPEGISALNVSGYLGKDGSNEPAKIERINSHITKFSAERPLYSKEGIAVAVSFDKGLLKASNEANLMHRFYAKIIKIGHISYESAVIMVMTLLLLVYYLTVWYKFGKDEVIKDPKLQFSGPKDVSLLDSSVIWHGRGLNKEKAFYATLIDLAAKGNIEFDIDKGVAKRLEEGTTLYEYERNLLNNLFSKGSVSLKRYGKSILNAYNKFMADIAKTRTKHVKENKIFTLIGLIFHTALIIFLPEDGNLTLRVFASLGITLFYTPFFFLSFNLLKERNLIGYIVSIFIILHYLVFFLAFPLIFSGSNGIDILFSLLVFSSCIIHYVFYVIMDKPLPQAVETLGHLKGLYNYMSVAEKETYKRMSPEIFEKNLPYAIIFGLEKEWFERLKKAFPTYNPEWFVSDKTIEVASIFTIHQNLTQGKTRYEAKTSSGHSSGGGSGFGSSSGSGGGGSSGGGSGGGGGGGR